MATLCDEAKDRLHDAVDGSKSIGSLAQVLVGLFPKTDNPYEMILDCLNQTFGEQWPPQLRDAMQMAASLNQAQSMD